VHASSSHPGFLSLKGDVVLVSRNKWVENTI